MGRIVTRWIPCHKAFKCVDENIQGLSDKRGPFSIVNYKTEKGKLMNIF